MSKGATPCIIESPANKMRCGPGFNFCCAKLAMNFPGANGSGKGANTGGCGTLVTGV